MLCRPQFGSVWKICLSLVLSREVAVWPSDFCPQLGGLTPLHVSCSLPGEGCLQLTSLLLRRGADPAVTCDPGPALLDAELFQRRRLPRPQLLGARTPLHVICQRTADSYDKRVVSQAVSFRLKSFICILDIRESKLKICALNEK